jgi:hypothetical protein
MNISEIIPQDDYVLLIRSEDGKAGLFDIKPYLDSEVFSPLRDKAEFARLHNAKYFIEWDCGADLSAETVHARRESVLDRNAQRSIARDSASAQPLS